MLHVIQSISRLGGGVVPVVQGFAGWGWRLGVRSTIATLVDPYTEPTRKSFADSELIVCRRTGPFFLARSREMKSRLNKLPDDIDVVHAHAIWGMVQKTAADFARRREVPLVLSPHGMLAPQALRRSRWKKTIMRAVTTRRHRT